MANQYTSPWTEAENEVLRNHLDLLNNELARLLPSRSVGAIQGRMYKLGLKKEPIVYHKKAIKGALAVGWHPWSPEEIEILKNSYLLPSKKTILHILPGRDWQAIQNKACKLGLNRNKVVGWKGPLDSRHSWKSGNGYPLSLREKPWASENNKRRLGYLNPNYGKPSPLKGRHQSELTKEKISKASKEHWQLKEYREKVISNTLKSLSKRPTRGEKRLIKVINGNKLGYEYVGNGSVILGRLNPDFINCNGRKKVIELFGRFFHDPNKTFKSGIPLRSQELYRKAIFAALGFDCLVLWDDEMKKLSDEEIAARIIKFTKSRRKVTAQLELFREAVAGRV